MRFISFKTNNFRNLGNESIEVNSKDIIFSAINGQGKTNLLEAIYTICYGSSFRTNNLKEIIKHGEKFFSAEAIIENSFGDKDHIKFIFSDNKKQISINEKKIKDRKELIYQYPCIVFSHEDINFVKGEPEYRRKFFDQVMSMYNPLFLDDLRRYKHLLNQRNSAIKNGQFSLLPLYDERLAKLGLNIMNERIQTIYEFNQIFPKLYKKISGTNKNIIISYIPSWKGLGSIDEICTYLEGTRERDRNMQTTTSGIHRDRFIVVDEEGPFNQTGSTGQIRLASLLFRVAQARYFTHKTKKEPIILLDDVLLELDSEKRASFLKEIKNYSQAFYTFLPKENYFEVINQETIEYKIKDGNIEKNE